MFPRCLPHVSITEKKRHAYDSRLFDLNMKAHEDDSNLSTSNPNPNPHHSNPGLGSTLRVTSSAIAHQQLQQQQQYNLNNLNKFSYPVAIDATHHMMSRNNGSSPTTAAAATAATAATAAAAAAAGAVLNPSQIMNLAASASTLSQYQQQHVSHQQHMVGVCECVCVLD